MWLSFATSSFYIDQVFAMPLEYFKKQKKKIQDNLHFSLPLNLLKERSRIRKWVRLEREAVGKIHPDVKAVKNRIDDLITRNYLERDKDNPNVFRYLA
ncbi:hypothetical protein QVD17_13874 [Tagetes erecta]|uniref:Uncharacterized protein n=1 Tax=Tagetes erecta TaxID=13708 RepID=A0AAD8P3I5_TARER|nr:hypothetical protein QVD17_13874 [Tagetes erecta]